MTDPLEFLTRLREAHPDFEHIFQNGCCYELARIMQAVWPQARALYDGDHVFVEIDGSFYDIRGRHENPPGNLVPVDPERRPWDWKESAPRIHGNREALEGDGESVLAMTGKCVWRDHADGGFTLLDEGREAVKAERERIFDWLRKNLPDGHAIVAAIREGDSDVE